MSRTPADPVTAYAGAVTRKRRPIVAGPLVRLACERHLRDLKRAKVAGLKWESEKALAAIQFFTDMLPLEDGSPFALLPWQQFVVGSLFGWYSSDGGRRFRTAYIETGKGSGKTPMAAGVGLFGMIADGEPAPEIYSAATTRDQASIVFKDAKRMVESSPELADLVEPGVGHLEIPTDHAIFRPVSSEHKGLDGKRPHIALIDELHEHPTALVVDKMRAGTKRRFNALIFEITNSGYDRRSVCWQHHEYSRKVLEGSQENDAWFAYVCALDKGDDWRDEKVWLKANPGIDDRLPPRKYLRELVEESVGMPSKQNISRRLNFCEWTEQCERWIEMSIWDENAGAVISEALRGRACYGGLDLATVRDVAALELLFPPEDEEEPYAVLSFFWVPEEGARKRTEKDRLSYDDWVRAGLMKSTSGDVIDYDVIREDIKGLADIYQIRAIAYDRWNSSQLVHNLMSDGAQMVPWGQGYASMSAPTKQLEVFIAGRKLRHGGNPVLRWMASNVAIKQDPAGNWKPDKASSAEKIDGMVGLVMALGLCMNPPEHEGPSIYDDAEARPDGILTLDM